MYLMGITYWDAQSDYRETRKVSEIAQSGLTDVCCFFLFIILYLRTETRMQERWIHQHAECI